MGYRRTPLAPDEWYHCFTRSIDGGSTFSTQQDYDRFAEALYLSNGTEVTARGNLKRASHSHIFSIPRGEQIVAVGAYCVMPNHFHILLKEVVEGGITRFMHRLGTSYSMYFNLKHSHIGNVFIKPFRAKHISDDRYLKRVAEYIHLNPAELYEHGWKRGNVHSLDSLHQELARYQYSSLPEYLDPTLGRPEMAILDRTSMALVSPEGHDYELTQLLTERNEYYAALYV